MAAFHFVSGIIRNDVRLLTLSVTVVFLYGGMVWGLLPINPDVSWEGHLWGAVSGVVLALYYRNYIIRRNKFDWEDDEDEESEDGGKEEVEGEGEEKASDSEEIKKQRATVLPQNPQNETRIPDNISHTGQF